MIVVKVGVFLTFIRLCTFLFFGVDIVYKIILLSSLGSLFIGAIGSLSQKKLKRFFTYSSLSQLGFSILGLITGTMQGLESSFFFFILYLLCSLGVFLILLNTEKYISGENLIYFTDFTNFGKYNLGTSLSLCIILFSMAGIPPLGGFFSKALVIKALIESSFYGLAIYGIIMGAINTFIYIRLIKCIISDKIYTYVNKDIPKQYSDYFLFRPYSQA
jgi:NADH:ubiquinone oxidoreductase subunit 2 (subunit N)